ncbi:MAG: 2-hydroxyacyl-CoA dehydratase subunit D [Candidatus Hodarchaeales archaeon]|jgi:benzoyl-CoA reductase/2-hydroxyglutaryl-CoA dehydratase subunit BcrC/BadD/HgdB
MGKSPVIKSTQELKNIATAYYKELETASKDPDQKIAWCSSVGPAELLLAMDFEVYYPENHSAMLGASRTANKFIPLSVAQGYSPEICSYLTSDIGAYLKKETPFTKAYGINEIPKPDVLVYNTNQCRDVQDWFSFYANELDVPIFGINSPVFINELKHSHIRVVADQMKDLTESLEDITDHPLERKKLQERLKLSLECSKIWLEVLNTAANVPSPLTFFDSCIHMLPAVVLRGNQIAIDYYSTLKDELKIRIEKQISAVPHEKFRVFWEGMPIWGKLRALSDQLYDLQSCVVASTYCNSWIFSDFNPNEPFLSMAKAYTNLFINRSETGKISYLKQMIREYKIDGIIFHNARTCPNNSNTQYGMPKRLEKQTGIPNLVIEADLNDLNVYSEEQTKTNIEAFVEQLAGI